MVNQNTFFVLIGSNVIDRSRSKCAICELCIGTDQQFDEWQEYDKHHHGWKHDKENGKYDKRRV